MTTTQSTAATACPPVANKIYQFTANKPINSAITRLLPVLEARGITPKFFIVGVTGLSIKIANDVMTGQARLDVVEVETKAFHTVTMNLRGEEAAAAKLKEHYAAHKVYPVVGGFVESAKFGKSLVFPQKNDDGVVWKIRAGVKKEDGEQEERGIVLLPANDTYEPTGKLVLRAGTFLHSSIDDRNNCDLNFSNMTVKVYEDRAKGVDVTKFRPNETYVLTGLRPGRAGNNQFNVAGFFASYTTQEAISEFGITSAEIKEATTASTRIRQREELISEEF